MTSVIIILLAILTYMIVRDIVVSKKRRANLIYLKRVSAKFDNLSKEAKKQSRLFTQLLDILSKEEDEHEDE